MRAVYVQTSPEIAAAPWFAYVLSLLPGLCGIPGPVRAGSEDVPAAEAATIRYGVRSAAQEGPDVPLEVKERLGRMALHWLDCGEVGRVRVPLYTAAADLFFNLFAYASCLEEHQFEQERGPLHSYAFRLGTFLPRFERPHAHFIALALRAILERTAPDCLSPLPGATRLYLTHDVDVIRKSRRTRFKEGAFRLFAGLKRGRLALQEVGRMLFGAADYFQLPAIAALEEQHGVRSQFNVFADAGGSTLPEKMRSLVFDPAYHIAREPKLRHELAALRQRGFGVGVHFAFDSWRRHERMAVEKAALERALGGEPIRSCRQHWLRFSLSETWAAQERCGITVDMTSCFNDVPGFRAGLARPYHPYDHGTGRARSIVVLPTVLMDTQLHYYLRLDRRAREGLMADLLADLQLVGGAAAVIWHSHVFSPDHGWEDDYRFLLSRMQALNIEGAVLGDGRAPGVLGA